MAPPSPSLYAAAQLPQPPWRTARLVLRPYEPAEAEMAHAALDRDEEVWRYDPGEPPTLARRRATIERFRALRAQFGFGPCAAFLADAKGREGPLIGQGGLNPYIYDERDGTRTVAVEVMYKLARPYWRQGFATEIARFWVDFAFDAVRLRELLTCPSKRNRRSIAVLERLGAEIEDDWLDDDAVIARLRNGETRA